MTLVKGPSAFGQRNSSLNQLLQLIHKEIRGLLLLLASKIAIQVRDTDTVVILKLGEELVNNNRRDYCLARRRYDWAI